MAESFRAASSTAIEKQGNTLPASAIGCTGSPHVAAARALWPSKTAEHWAYAAGKQARCAKYWIATGEVSEAGRLALVRLLA